MSDQAVSDEALSDEAVSDQVGLDLTVDVGSVGIWTGVLDALEVAEAQEAAVELDELGFGALWIPETVGRDPFVMAALLLSACDRMPVATGIASIYARDPLTMANTLRSLEAAFPARFLLGLGVSHHTLVEWVRKHDYSKPYSYMKDYLTFMIENSRFRGVGPRELPGNIVLAALGPKMLALSGELSAGAHPYFTTPEHTALSREILGDGPLLAPEQMCVLDSNAESARATARKNMAIYLSLPNYANNLKRLGFSDDDIGDADSGPTDRLVDAIVVWGDEGAVAERVREHHDAGADHVCVQVLADDPAAVQAGWRRLAPALLI